MRLLSLLCAAALAVLSLACSTGNQVSDLKVLIGATAVFQPGGNPVQDSVIVIAGDKIRAAGLRRDVPIPQDSERLDLAGKWVVPVSGGKLAPGAPADLFVLNTAENGSPAVGAPARHMIHGHWQ
jgi:cytosine/adenosine deaminase-related metal-dependent hydrolase